MAEFWDARARENAAYFVDSRLDYENPDLDAFWEAGVEVMDGFGRMLDVHFEPEDDVVEIGCGIGRLTRVISSRARTVRALDISAEMLEQAREHNGALANVEWILGDGDSLEGVEDASADAVFSHVVFQHIPEPAITYRYVEEIGRVLRPGGWAAFQVSDSPAVHEQRLSFRERVRAVLGNAPKGVDHAAWRGSAVDLGELRAAAARGGLEVERIHGEGTQYCLVRLRCRG